VGKSCADQDAAESIAPFEMLEPRVELFFLAGGRSRISMAA
jgi:hypothetical protein